MSPFDILGLPEESTLDAIRARWRELASEHHPDKGGDSEAFQVCRQAYIEALKIAEQPKPCLECGGAGKVQVRQGFNQITITCTVCRGSCTR